MKETFEWPLVGKDFGTGFFAIPGRRRENNLDVLCISFLGKNMTSKARAQMQDAAKPLAGN
jgi:hypothetical protein